MYWYLTVTLELKYLYKQAMEYSLNIIAVASQLSYFWVF